MNIKNYKNYACFDYKSVESKTHKLGDVVIKDGDNGDIPEIGVIIQIHGENKFRTDMFGNASTSEVRTATDEEIVKYRPNLLNEELIPIFPKEFTIADMRKAYKLGRVDSRISERDGTYYDTFDEFIGTFLN